MEDDNRVTRDYDLASSLLGWQALTDLVTAKDSIEKARLKLMACQFGGNAAVYLEASADMMDSRIQALSDILLAHVPEDIFNEEDEDETGKAAELR